MNRESKYHGVRFEAKNVLVQKIDDEMVLLNVGDERYFSLDRVGVGFWEVLTDSMTFEETVEELEKKYDVDGKTLAHDLSQFIDELLNAGLLDKCKAR